ncbi:hypothetical protein TKK_0019340 [Trichogramma kaykai]|uniref:chymotrypsin n=1 Tax=Trichogramma kaykai TaxID=54128 RepID=A0ABD2VT02_9HYME
MSTYVLVLSCLLALASAGPFATPEEPIWSASIDLNAPRQVQTRVVGGANARVGQFPHQVSLQFGPNPYQLSHFCGGTILSERVVLTAGHCVAALPPQGGVFVVKAGKNNVLAHESNEQTVRVKFMVTHELYQGGVAPYDISLLFLESPLQFNNCVAPIALPKAGVEPSGEVELSGWGSTSRTQQMILPAILQYVKLPVLDIQTCARAINTMSRGARSPLHTTNVCTGPLDGGAGACRGDSGGPLISRQNGHAEVVGVVSWGFVPCGGYGAPSVFVKVADFVDWINENVAKYANYV